MVQNGRPLGEMVIKLGLDSSAFSDSLTGATRATKTAVKEMQAGFKIATAGGKSVNGLKVQYDGLTKTITAQKNELKYLKQAYEKTLDEQGNATSKTAKAAQKYNEALQKLSAYEAQLKTTAGQLARMRVETEGVTGFLNRTGDALISAGGKLEKIGGQFQKAGSFATKAFTVPLVAGFTASTKAAVEFQSQIGAIGPLLTDGKAITKEYQEQLDRMSASSKQWSKDYGIHTREINNGLAEIVRKGYDANQTLGVMPSILDATKASGEGFNDVMNVTTEVISQFNLKGKTYEETLTNATRVTDSLTYVANATSAGFVDLGQAMAYVGPVANSLGMTVEETASAIGILSDAGIGGEKAGTALRGALTRLLKPSKQNIEGFEKLGISVEDFANGAMSLPDMLDKIKTNTEGWTDAQRTAAIALAFGTESQSAMNVLVGQGGEALRGLTKDTNNAAGATKEIARSLNNLPQNKVERFKQSLNVLGITIGEKLLPTFTPLIEKATAMINKFSELDEETQQNIIQWGLMAAAVGPVVGILGKVISVTGSTAKGVGELSKSIVELAARSAEKKALADAGKAIASIGSSSATATGSVSALTSGLGLLNPWVLGVTAAVGLGYGAWKLWGEEAWNSAQRTKRWGTDVGEATDEALGKVEGYSQGAIGQFGLMEQGLSGNVDSMIGNFQKMGKSIETDLNRQIEAFRKSIEMLPEEIQAEAQEIVENAAKEREEALKIVEENNKRVAEIKKQAAQNNRDITLNEAKMIKDLMTEAATEYLNITVTDAEARKKVLSAMTGDVETATAEQAKAWLQSLGKQRQETKASYTKQLEDYKEFLDEQGILNTTEGQKLVELFEKSKEASTKAIDEQMAVIAEKYPELLDEVLLANGQLASSMGEAGEQVRQANEKILENVDTMSEKIRVSAEKNAKELGMMGDESTRAGARWNSIVLDEKTGEVKTNAVEEVVKATESVGDWNELAFTAHEAKLESNAKLVIAEAALANGHWGSLEFMGKEALIESNATRTMIEAMQQQGIWEGISFEEKKAILYSDTPEKVAEAVFNMGLWDKLSPTIKELEADNYNFLNKLSESETALAEYNSISPELKTLLADGPAKMTIDETKLALEQYENLTPELKALLATNEDALVKVQTAEAKMIAYNALPTDLKLLEGDNSSVVNSSDIGQQAVEAYNRKNALIKDFMATNTDVVSKSEKGTEAVIKYDRINAEDKIMKATDYASGPANSATEAVRGFARQSDSTVTLTTKHRTIWETVKSWVGFAKGTDYHYGGPAMVNDQRGSLYREYVELPDGRGFIPEGRNVLLNLPRGTKVLKASDTKQLFPHYADGVGGVPKNATVIENMQRINQQSRDVSITNDFSGLESLLKQMLNVVSRLQPVINVNPVWNTEDDIRDTSKQLAWLTQIDARGGLE